MFPDMPKKRLPDLAAIPTGALNSPGSGEVFRRPARPRRRAPCPVPEPSPTVQAPHDQNVARSVSA